MEVTVIFLLLVCVLCSFLQHLDAVNRQRQPNIILILTDDQDKELGSMKFMPKVQRLMTQAGADFSNAFVTTPMCCPSRSSMLTGLYTHNHHVYTNHDNCSSYDWRQKYETRTFGYTLQQHGYRTAYIGKYLNEYNGTYIPQGWNDWIGLLYNSKYYNYTLNVNGRLQSHGFNYARDYLPDLIANESVRLLRQQRRFHNDKPLLLVLSFPSPHGREVAAPQYQKRFYGPAYHSHRTPAWNSAPSPDKEWLLRHTAQMTPLYKKFTDILQQKRLQTLLSVDDAVEKLITSLENLDMINKTFIFYTSDHGYHAGQFGLIKGKSLPYDFDVKVPFIVRGPGVGRGTRIKNIVLNVDLAPTMLELAGLGVNNAMDGRSILKLLSLSNYQRGPRTNGTLEVRRAKAWRESFLIERGKLTSRIVRLRDKLEASKNRIVSKRARLEEECKSHSLRYPCETNQKWFCWRRSDGTGLRKLKCRHGRNTGLNLKLNEPPIATPRGRQLCPCISNMYRLLPKVRGADDRSSMLPERRMKENEDFALWKDPLLKNISSANFSRQCRFVSSQQRVVCSPYHSEREWARDSKAVDQVIHILKKYYTTYSDLRRVLRRSKPHPVRLCDCRFMLKNVKMSRRRDRRNRRNRRRRQKKKKHKLRYCNKRNMNCFVHTRDHWRTPPFWPYMPICFCANSNNNTYWCVRTINDTHNTLYCEYVTGFISYFDLNLDPYQLKNMVGSLPFAKRMEMHRTLSRLRRCRGPRQCTVRSTPSSARPAIRHRRRRWRRKLQHRWRQLIHRSM